MATYDSFAKKWVENIRSGKNLNHDYLEKPAMYAKLPDLHGKSILSLGCGTGEEVDHLEKLGASRVIGVDISEPLIEIAKESFPNLEFQVMDMEKLNFPAGSFDLVYSSLTLHYSPSWSNILTKVYSVLKPGGSFLFSTHHPIKWGSEITRGEEKNSFILGYEKYKSSPKQKIFGDYQNSRKVNDKWFGEFEVTFFHRPIAEILKEIIKSKFQLVDFIEPKSTIGAKELDEGWWEINQKIPQFMIFELKKT